MVKKIGQIKIQQMAFMLIAVTLFFVLVGLLVFTFKFSDMKNSATELEEKNSILLVAKISETPEFSCGNSFGNERTNCIDADKVMMLKEDIKKYSDFWGVSNIEIRKIYPKLDREIICDIGNYPDCNIIRIIKNNISGFSSSNFVSLCRKESEENNLYDKCELAKVIVSYEEK